MSDLNALQDAFLKADALAQQGDAQAREDAAMFAAEIRRIQSSGGTPERAQGQSIMSNVNRGIADAAGGLVDLLNPFDKPHALNPFSEGTGSAQSGLASLMERGGIDVAKGAPDGILSAMARGGGEAAGSIIPAAKGAQLLGKAGGVVGGAANEVLRGLLARGGVAAEVTGGAVSGGAEKMAADAGLPEWAQGLAAIAAPASVPAAVGAARGAGRLAGKISPIKRGADAAAAAVAPYTKKGAQAVASNRLRSLAGGDARAEELAGRISGDNPLNLTPAQQTQDPNMIGIERLAARSKDRPLIRESLAARADQGRATAVDELRAGAGNAGDAQSFFSARRKEFGQRIRAKVDDILGREQAAVSGIKSNNYPGDNSAQVHQRIERALDDAKLDEKALWEAVPQAEAVGTAAAKEAAADIVAKTPRAQRNDIPRVVSELLVDDGGFGDQESVMELYGLYSELRRVARSAMAGNDKNANMARISNKIADAILDDLGAVDGTTHAGRAINEARAYSAAMHETFDQGAVGRLLKRTLDGDTATNPELALERTVGRGGTQAKVAADEIQTAAPSSEPFVRDYIKGMFHKSAITPEGEFTAAGAARFRRDNAELLRRYPALDRDITEAVQGRESADMLAARMEKRLRDLADAKKSATAAFLNASPEKAFKAVTDARNPVKAARSLAAEARKDTSGAAMAGLKDAFSRHLIGGDLTGSAVLKRISNPEMKLALRHIYSDPEMRRMEFIAKELAKLDASEVVGANVGDNLSGAKANRAIEFAVRILAANQGAKAGQGAASLQTAQMASGRAKDFVNSLARDRAADLIADAVQDPELFRALLLNTKSPGFEKATANLFLPYMVGGTAAAATE